MIPTTILTDHPEGSDVFASLIIVPMVCVDPDHAHGPLADVPGVAHINRTTTLS